MSLTLCCIVCLLLIVSNGQILVESSVKQNIQEEVLDCIAVICEKYFTTSGTLALSSSKETGYTNALLQRLHFMKRWPIVMVHPSKQAENNAFCTIRKKHGYYILLVEYNQYDEVVKYFTEQVQQLESVSSWNSKALFIVLVTENVANFNNETIISILKEFSDRKAVNTVLLIPSSEIHKEVHILSWFPYGPPSGQCGKIKDFVVLDIWDSEERKFRTNNDIFPDKIPPYLGSCPVRIYFARFPPYMIFSKSSGEDPRTITGMEGEMLKIMAERMNFSLVMNEEDSMKDSKYENGQWTTAVGDLVYDRSDIAMDGWCQTLDYSKVVDYSRHYHAIQFTWFLPIAQTQPRWFSLYRVFSTEVWIVCILTIILVALAIRFLAKKQLMDESPNFKNVAVCFSYTWAVLLCIGIPRKPSSTILRIVFFSLIVYSLAISTVFQATFTSYMVDPGLQHQIDTTEEVLNSDLFLHILDLTYPVLNQSQLAKRRHANICASSSECLEKFYASSTSSAVLTGSVNMKYKTGQLEDGKNLKYHKSTESVYYFYVIMMLQKGSLLKERIDDIINKMLIGGLPLKFLKDALPRIFLKDVENNYVPMSISHLQSGFFLVTVGVLISVLTFLCEILYSLHKNGGK